MANRYWVGGAGTWNTTSTTNWSTASGGASGASVPTTADSVFFDQAGTYTVTMTGGLACLDITVSAGTVTFAQGTTPTLNIAGSMSLRTGTVWSMTGGISFTAASTGKTVTTNGTTLSATSITFNGGGAWTLGSALTTTGNVAVAVGSFDSAGYAISSTQLSSNGTFTRSISLGSSTVSCSSSGATTLNFANVTNLTFNAGTSQINLTAGASGISSGGLTFYNVSFTNTALTSATITGANTFNILYFEGRTTAGIATYTFSANQTINSTLQLYAGSNTYMRHFVASDVIGTQRTLTCNAIDSIGTGQFIDADFRDINFAGNCISAGNVTGARLGNCKGNANITFDTPKTVYWRTATSTNWGTNSWSATSGGTLDPAMFPLAQDTAVFPAATYPASGSTITLNAAYNIGTIDMSLRTSNTMTLAMGITAPTIYGNWINGTGTTLSGTGRITFSGRVSQTITSAGKTWTQLFTVNSPSGSVTLQDAFTASQSSATVLTITSGTFDAATYNVTLSGALAAVSSSGTGTRTIAFGSGTWSIAGSGTAFDASTSTNLTVTGNGTISLTSASAKTFAGGGIQTYPTLSQGGTGALTVSGSNKFTSMTNTAIGSVLFTGGTTNEFTSSFSLKGSAVSSLTLSSTNTTQAILKKPSAWLMGLLSINAGNNTGLTFLASDGTMEYLTVSYINGQVAAAYVNGNFFVFFT